MAEPDDSQKANEPAYLDIGTELSQYFEAQSQPQTRSRKRKRGQSPSEESHTQPLREAIQFAEKMQSIRFDPPTRRYIYWTDASVYRRCAAGAVVWLASIRPEKWTEKGYPFPIITDCSELVEVFAIATALETAVAHVTKPSRLFHDRYFMHVQSAIEHIQKLREMGARVGLHLVPGHNGVAGNERAHNMAKKTARKLASRQIPKYIYIPVPIPGRPTGTTPSVSCSKVSEPEPTQAPAPSSTSSSSSVPRQFEFAGVTWTVTG
ncbi:hypothetical protein NUU61_001739 [Penicillium alfredii]|uniref:RNase H type-1 domain-containing protein n=1 Tax=Penicillium alfredii TaxID=1506179 RepID=A0A9W9FQV7_9EURO|nr:uncharacterized protein NUU61_001739 [Penicillium alfredii]KAJ5104392.1 hypothetical protein NUU61_001739 [Penicillium alfredii]